MKTTRREFFAGMVSVALLPNPAPAKIERYWISTKWSGWREPEFLPDPDWSVNVHRDRFAQLIGLRSDGQLFYISVTTRSWNRKYEALKEDYARIQLDSFLNCECKLRAPCERHRRHPLTPEELSEIEA